MKIIRDQQLVGKCVEAFNLETSLGTLALSQAEVHCYEKEERVLEADQDLTYYYIVLTGEVKVSYMLENGKSVVLKFYSSGYPIGDMELLKGEPVRCDVSAVTNTELLAIPTDFIRRSCMDDPVFLKHLALSLGDKLYATLNNSAYNMTYPLLNRLSSFLQAQFKSDDQIVLQASYTEIAQFLGATYRHLNRTFKELEEQGVIRVEGKHVYLLNRDQLETLAKTEFLRSL